jgi:hypothetical protein
LLLRGIVLTTGLYQQYEQETAMIDVTTVPAWAALSAADELGALISNPPMLGGPSQAASAMATSALLWKTVTVIAQYLAISA